MMIDTNVNYVMINTTYTVEDYGFMQYDKNEEILDLLDSDGNWYYVAMYPYGAQKAAVVFGRGDVKSSWYLSEQMFDYVTIIPDSLTH